MPFFTSTPKSGTPVKRSSLHYTPLTKEEARKILASPYKTGYTYAQSSTYNSSYPTEYIHPNFVGDYEYSDNTSIASGDSVVSNVYDGFTRTVVSIIRFFLTILSYIWAAIKYALIYFTPLAPVYMLYTKGQNIAGMVGMVVSFFKRITVIGYECIKDMTMNTGYMVNSLRKDIISTFWSVLGYDYNAPELPAEDEGTISTSHHHTERIVRHEEIITRTKTERFKDIVTYISTLGNYPEHMVGSGVAPPTRAHRTQEKKKSLIMSWLLTVVGVVYYVISGDFLFRNIQPPAAPQGMMTRRRQHELEEEKKRRWSWVWWILAGLLLAVLMYYLFGGAKQPREHTIKGVNGDEKISIVDSVYGRAGDVFESTKDTASVVSHRAGNGLLWIYSKFVGSLFWIYSNVIDVFSSIFKHITGFGSFVLRDFTGATRSISSKIVDGVRWIPSKVADGGSYIYENAVGAVYWIPSKIGETGHGIYSSIGHVPSSIYRHVTGFFSFVYRDFTGSIQWIFSKLTGSGSSVFQTFIDGLDWIILSLKNGVYWIFYSIYYVLSSIYYAVVGLLFFILNTLFQIGHYFYALFVGFFSAIGSKMHLPSMPSIHINQKEYDRPKITMPPVGKEAVQDMGPYMEKLKVYITQLFEHERESIRIEREKLSQWVRERDGMKHEVKQAPLPVDEIKVLIEKEIGSTDFSKHIHEHVHNIVTKNLNKYIHNDVSMENLEPIVQKMFETEKQNIRLEMHKLGQSLLEKESIKGKLSSEELESLSQYIYTNNNFSMNVEQYIINIVNQRFKKYMYDRTGEPDYALETSGGFVVSTRCTEDYKLLSRLEKVFGFALWYTSYSPRTPIQRLSQHLNPGECWAVKGQQAYLVIQLSQQNVNVTAFSYEHIPIEISTTGNINSAPQGFKIWSLQSEHDPEKFLLGEYRYDIHGEPLQRFPTQHPDPRGTIMVEFELLSNYGEIYTCLYRMRVHGNHTN